ncbi:putative serine/threonine-protein kinase WNK7 [Zea mays]|uniref:non-specific serine/threonine protein kinase n=1 Tax=Zea mays TaxID=4577 RepID=A0A3L6F9H2_MAIZE|nr:putative serine/threonine-protein kinase WNK7 [Zea mays]
MSAARRCGGRRRLERAAAAGDNANGYVETDPTGRYGRFDELLGKGAMKSVYRGFDEERGVEVAWNQASLADVLRSPDAVQRMYSEVQLLSELRHDGIIGFHASWVDVPGRSFNFITELFSSGTLRSYRLRYPRVSLRAVRSWARQLLGGLAYLHARDPPVIHRDLKCDNIFVNGHQGQVKIGDLGLAAVLRRGGAAHSVIGTPEFMAPEMYDEEYDERVDVYAFGMCMLEMLTVEYPYSECTNPAQIYKKVTAGRLPDAFYRVDDDDARRFIGRCLVPAANRPSAAELLLDPFLLHHHHHHAAAAGTVPVPTTAVAAGAPPPSTCSSSAADDDVVSALDDDDEVDVPPALPPRNDMTITGKLNAEEDTIFLKVQIADEASGHARNIYFPFDMASDTAAEVAQEMVKELDITDRHASEIAAMIQQEIGRLLPGRAQQHEYTYASRGGDYDDEERPPPFYYLSSSPASSHGSHCGVGPYAFGGFSGPCGSAWTKDHDWYALSDNDDDMSSVHSGKYSPVHYASGAGHEEAPASSSGSSKTRFGGGGSGSAAALARQLERQCSVSPQHAGRPRRREDDDDRAGRRRRMTRNRSMVDMRSQLLHRTLVEELNRRLFFNTVGAVENIGFRAPTTTAASSARGGLDRGRRPSGGGKQQQLDDKQQQYFML